MGQVPLPGGPFSDSARKVICWDRETRKSSKWPPNVVPRAWGRWDTVGTLASQYNFGYPAQAKAAGIVFIGGTTATVLFKDEFSDPTQFNAVVSCNAQGQPVQRPDPQNFYRGSMASPAYRQYIIGIGEIQIDGGVDGIFLDEVSGSYQGATFNNNEGFDDADVADFGGFLCAKYPNLTAAQWQSQFGVTAAARSRPGSRHPRRFTLIRFPSVADTLRVERLIL